MSEKSDQKDQKIVTPEVKKKRRFLSAEKKYQVFLEHQSGKTPVGELLRREGLYSTDLVRICHKVKEGALQRLADKPGAPRKTVSKDAYDGLKHELEEKERALAELSVELAILKKKANGGSWER
jgi:transposase-like protein